ncbi:hypothetical protein ACU21_01460 [Actinobaculum suis]|uniref:hypothetical protein n=1 Tax=Actinobaculum suis TaxID=1657 RepID=UPI0008088100|nr:hypothetical protein [Actinobaculum suis]OCA93141.1 hypothetical protein ACU21_01460 [Actinobaculum suis]
MERKNPAVAPPCSTGRARLEEVLHRVETGTSTARDADTIRAYIHTIETQKTPKGGEDEAIRTAAQFAQKLY